MPTYSQYRPDMIARAQEVPGAAACREALRQFVREVAGLHDAAFRGDGTSRGGIAAEHAGYALHGGDLDRISKNRRSDGIRYGGVEYLKHFNPTPKDLHWFPRILLSVLMITVEVLGTFFKIFALGCACLVAL